MKFFILKANLNCADDNVLYAFGSSMTEVKDKLSQDLPKLSEWFTENFMILNPDKCHYMCLGKDTVNDILNFCDEELKSSELETVLGIEIDQKLTFNCHVKTLVRLLKNRVHYKKSLILLMKKREIYYLMRSLNLNLATVPLYGCLARDDQII